jgi:hypothetical protein
MSPGLHSIAFLRRRMSSLQSFPGTSPDIVLPIRGFSLFSS